jgi:hypothetical protein
MQPFRGSVEMMPGWIEGVLQHGHGVASGANSESPYPKGSISIQRPFFKALGLDLSCYWQGTINLSFKPLEIVLRNPDITFENMYWTDLHPPETFSFWNIKLRTIDNHNITGLIYYPHPETKARHWQSSSVLEILAPRMTNLGEGSPLQVKASEGCLQLIDGARLRAKLLEFLKFRVLASPDHFFANSSHLGIREWLSKTNPEFLILPNKDLDYVWNQAKTLYTET